MLLYMLWLPVYKSRTSRPGPIGSAIACWLHVLEYCKLWLVMDFCLLYHGYCIVTYRVVYFLAAMPTIMYPMWQPPPCIKATFVGLSVHITNV